MVERADGASFSGDGWTWQPDPTRFDLAAIVTTVLGLAPAAQIAAVAALRSVWSGSAAVLNLLVAAVEAIQARRDAPWNEVLAEEGIPLPGEEGGGEWVSVGTLQATYGARQDAGGGWFLVNMVHDLVADEIAAEAGNMITAPVAVEGQAPGEHQSDVVVAPVAVEGQSLGDRRTDIVVPPSAEEAAAIGLPYMIAEVKAFGANNRADAREQLEDAELWLRRLVRMR